MVSKHAVGSKSFVEGIKEKLGIRATGRKVADSKDLYHLREAQAAYNSNFTPEKGVLRAKNTYFGSVIHKYQHVRVVRPQLVFRLISFYMEPLLNFN